MTQGHSTFKLLDRGFKKILVLVPGWATDYRIFSGLKLDYNYLLVSRVSPSCFMEDLSQALEERALEKVSIFGHSLGGFLAKDFALAFPKKTDELFLAGIRKRYRAEEIEGARVRVKKNRAAFLRRFYADCFSDGEEGRLWFKEHLLKTYLDEIRLEDLLRGLDHLSRVSIEPKDFKGLKDVSIFHGVEDKIAPFQEASEIAKGVPSARFIVVPKAGHMVFLNG
jgi:pimeloyl-ACP methyl ester carboxylesterase